MFTSIKRLLIVATMIVALSAATAAYAYPRPALGGSSTSGPAQASIAQSPTAAQLRQLRLGQLQAAVARPFSSQGGRPTIASRVRAAAPSAQAGFRWGDAGIGAAGVLALVGFGAGATLVIRRRVHQPLAS
jgi:hypothetical protein